MEGLLPSLGERLLEMQTGALEVRSKTGAHDIVTRADLESEKAICTLIEENFPRDEILAEESASGSGTHFSGKADFCWLIDPVDGTTNYAHGLPLFGVSIGIQHGGLPAAGLVRFPALNATYRAVRGNGATKNGHTIRVSECDDLSSSLIVVGLGHGPEAAMAKNLENILGLARRVRGVRRMGSATLDLCWLADGRFELYFETHLSPWDTCAASVIAREAGARVTDFSGGEHNPFLLEIAASNGILHEVLLETLRRNET